MNEYVKFDEILFICSQDIEQKEILVYFKGHDSGTNVPKIMCDNPKLDLVNMNAYKKFGEFSRY